MNILPFTIPFLAGISTIIGYFPTYIPAYYQNIVISLSLAFSSGVMLMVSTASLIPEAATLLSSYPHFSKILLLTIFFLSGGLLSSSMDFLISHTTKNNDLYKVGLISFTALLFHNIPEGITTFLATSHNITLGLTLSIAIAFHNIPEGIMIAVPIYYSTKNHLKSFLYTLFAGFSEVFGAIIAFLFLKNNLHSFLLAFILTLTAGIMSYLAFFELLPKSFSYPYKKMNILSFLLGIITMYCCIFLLL